MRICVVSATTIRIRRIDHPQAYYTSRNCHAFVEVHLPDRLSVSNVAALFIPRHKLDADPSLRALLAATPRADGRPLAACVRPYDGDNDALVAAQEDYFRDVSTPPPVPRVFSPFFVFLRRGAPRFLPFRVDKGGGSIVMVSGTKNDVRAGFSERRGGVEGPVDGADEGVSYARGRYGAAVDFAFGFNFNTAAFIRVFERDGASWLAPPSAPEEALCASDGVNARVGVYFVSYDASSGWATMGRGEPPKCLCGVRGLKLKVRSSSGW